jgi:hypothetical protein
VVVVFVAVVVIVAVVVVVASPSSLQASLLFSMPVGRSLASEDLSEGAAAAELGPRSAANRVRAWRCTGAEAMAKAASDLDYPISHRVPLGKIGSDEKLHDDPIRAYSLQTHPDLLPDVPAASEQLNGEDRLPQAAFTGNVNPALEPTSRAPEPRHQRADIIETGTPNALDDLIPGACGAAVKAAYASVGFRPVAMPTEPSGCQAERGPADPIEGSKHFTSTVTSTVPGLNAIAICKHAESDAVDDGTLRPRPELHLLQHHLDDNTTLHDNTSRETHTQLHLLHEGFEVVSARLIVHPGSQLHAEGPISHDRT